MCPKLHQTQKPQTSTQTCVLQTKPKYFLKELLLPILIILITLVVLLDSARASHGYVERTSRKCIVQLKVIYIDLKLVSEKAFSQLRRNDRNQWSGPLHFLIVVQISCPSYGRFIRFLLSCPWSWIFQSHIYAEQWFLADGILLARLVAFASITTRTAKKRLWESYTKGTNSGEEAFGRRFSSFCWLWHHAHVSFSSANLHTSAWLPVADAQVFFSSEVTSPPKLPP